MLVAPDDELGLGFVAPGGGPEETPSLGAGCDDEETSAPAIDAAIKQNATMGSTLEIPSRRAGLGLPGKMRLL